MTEIKDSGERREFETGAVRDIQEGKGRCDLLPLDVVSWLTEDMHINNILTGVTEFQKDNDNSHLISVLRVSECLFGNCWTMVLE